MGRIIKQGMEGREKRDHKEKENAEERAKKDKEEILTIIKTREGISIVTDDKPVKIEIPKWTDIQTPSQFFDNFEDAMVANGD